MAIDQQDFWRTKPGDAVEAPTGETLYIFDAGVTRDGQAYLLIGSDAYHARVVTCTQGMIREHPFDDPSDLNDPRAVVLCLVTH